MINFKPLNIQNDFIILNLINLIPMSIEKFTVTSGRYDKPYSHFTKKSRPTFPKFKNYIRKCSYVISVIEPVLFTSLEGHWIIENEIGFIPRKYDGTSSGETYGLVAFSKRKLVDLQNPESQTWTLLRKSDVLKHVPGIDGLQARGLQALKWLSKFLYFVYDRELILFTLEPMGGIFYPSANLCLPGGGMESDDGYDWEKCAKREFLEETGIVIPEDKTKAKLITKQAFNLPDKFAMYFLWKIKSL
jgi:hypothetical protein